MPCCGCAGDHAQLAASLPASQRASESEELFLAKQGSQGEAAGYRGAPLAAGPLLQGTTSEPVEPAGGGSATAEAMRSIVPPSRGDSFAGSTASAEAMEPQHRSDSREAGDQLAGWSVPNGAAEHGTGRQDAATDMLLRGDGRSGAVEPALAEMSSPASDAAGWQTLSLGGEEDSGGLSPEVSLGFVPGDPADAASPHRQKEMLLPVPGVDTAKLHHHEQARAKGLDAATILQRIEQLAQMRTVGQQQQPGGDSLDMHA